MQILQNVTGRANLYVLCAPDEEPPWRQMQQAGARLIHTLRRTKLASCRALQWSCGRGWSREVITMMKRREGERCRLRTSNTVILFHRITLSRKKQLTRPVLWRTYTNRYT